MVLDKELFMSDDKIGPIHDKIITKMSWSNDGQSGIKVHFETKDGYVLTYLLGFHGDLKYLHTRDMG